MENNELKNKPTSKLEGELKGIKIISGALTGVLILLFGLLMIDDNLDVGLLVVGISSLAFLLLQFNSIKKIKAELKSRINS